LTGHLSFSLGSKDSPANGFQHRLFSSRLEEANHANGSTIRLAVCDRSRLHILLRFVARCS
jgi:hypothetical protein